MATPMEDEIVRYLTSTADCWWTVRRIGAVLPHARADIEMVLETCWQVGLLRRKRGPGGAFEYQVRKGEAC